jgi:hypothetical protein
MALALISGVGCYARRSRLNRHLRRGPNPEAVSSLPGIRPMPASVRSPAEQVLALLPTLDTSTAEHIATPFSQSHRVPSMECQRSPRALARRTSSKEVGARRLRRTWDVPDSARGRATIPVVWRLLSSPSRGPESRRHISEQCDGSRQSLRDSRWRMTTSRVAEAIGSIVSPFIRGTTGASAAGAATSFVTTRGAHRPGTVLLTDLRGRDVGDDNRNRRVLGRQ